MTKNDQFIITILVNNGYFVSYKNLPVSDIFRKKERSA